MLQKLSMSTVTWHAVSMTSLEHFWALKVPSRPFAWQASRLTSRLFHFIIMENVKQWSLTNASQRFLNSADVLLVLDNGVAYPCHSQILSLRSAIICKMLEDLAIQHEQHDKKVRTPLADFTEAQCSQLLAYFHLWITA